MDNHKANNGIKMLLAAILTFLLGSSARAQELIYNGEFGHGNEINSDYQYVPYDYMDFSQTMQVFDGCYTVGPFVPPSYPDWIPFHTVSGGKTQMLIVNGAADPDASVWNQTVEIRRGLRYRISFYLAEISTPDSVADIALEVNNRLIGHAKAPAKADRWKLCTFYWDSSLESRAYINLRDLNTDGVQNDFAIDNISMVPVGRVANFPAPK
jgi:hypothetical protein